MTNKKPTKQQLWTNQMLAFLHQYFIGISKLTCSQANCPLVLNWGAIEKKNSYQGKSALVKITAKEFAVVDLIAYQENDLGGYSDIEVQFKSGNTQRTKPTYEEPEQAKISGYQQPKPVKEIFLKDSEVIVFFNNSSKSANLEEAESIYLNDLWDLKEKIKWDQQASKKKIINIVEQTPDPTDKSYKIAEWEQDYIFWLAHPDVNNEIKNTFVYSADKGEERKQLHEDYNKEFSELRRVYGIRHLTSKKEDRQNNPEIELNEAQFIALERDKWRERNRTIKDAEAKQFCPGTHSLTYGAWQERQEAEIEQAKELKSEPSTQELENQWESIKKGSEEPDKK